MEKRIVICQRRVSELKLEFINPRKINKERLNDLRESLEILGDFGVIVIDENNVIIAGIQRVTALHADMKVDCKQLIGYSETEKQLINIRANQHSGNWNEKELEKILIELNQMDIDLKLTGLDSLDLEEIGIDLSLDENLHTELENIIPEAGSRIIIQSGDLIELGKHRLLCGDSTDRQYLEKLFDGRKCAMIFTDPPYNCDYKDVRGRKIKNDHFNGNGFHQFLSDFFNAVRDFTTGDLYVCMSSAESSTLKAAFQDNQGHFSDFIVWVKNHFTLGRANYQKQYEVILYGWFEKSSHYWAGRRNVGDVFRDLIKNEDGKTYLEINNSEIETNVWEFQKPVLNKEHPTMKPVSLIQRALVNSSLLNDIVYDGFLGSGSTLIAAEKSGRICYGIELDQHYCDVIIQRWCDFTGRDDVVINGTPVSWNEYKKSAD
jgi:DNA modification methylase